MTLFDPPEPERRCERCGDQLRDGVCPKCRHGFPTLGQARGARDRAMGQVDEHAEPEWKDVAYAWLIDYLSHHQTMFTDDLWALGLPPTRQDRALGPIVLRLLREGKIKRSGEYRQRTRGHAAEGPVWWSLIYRGAR